jgi:Ran GTPase-activating protein (RanGAP) involved in mRNA processing and transport
LFCEVLLCVGRPCCRYQQQQPELYPAAFNLNNALAGRQQMAALAQALPHMQQLTALLLCNNDIDDWALKVLAGALLQPQCSSINCLDLGYNRLGQEAPLTLAPLLHRRPGGSSADTAAAAAAAGGAGVVARTQLLKTSSDVRASCGGPLPSPAVCQHSQLLQLVLAGNAIGDAGAALVCKLVATGDSLLQLLDMSR